ILIIGFYLLVSGLRPFYCPVELRFCVRPHSDIGVQFRPIFAITAYGIAHVVALSGFHLVVLSFVIYWILYFPYKFFQDRYFPYRNRKLDILLITIAILFYYLILTDIVPSLLRSFCDVLFRYLFT
ncbi:ComEC/Rec2 family competence protein, partial [Aliarcobacter butzleri]